MHNDDLGEEMAARQNDRHGNAPLTRGPDPDRVAAHLATGEGEAEKLISAKAVDGFKTESPIRAFTDFQVAGAYAIGKGFRPSLAHLARYLDAMEAKEGWALLQVILPRDSDGEPTIMFRKADLLAPPPFEKLFPEGVPDLYADLAEHLHGAAEPVPGVYSERQIGKHPALAAPYTLSATREPFKPGEHGGGYAVERAPRFKPGAAFGTHDMVEDPDNPDQRPAIEREIDAYDDANPAHYAGWECGDIGERLSANGYQMLKYVWRLGKKDDACKEIGKAIRYCERERDLLNAFTPGDTNGTVRPNVRGLGADEIEPFLESRIADQPVFTQNIARMLWQGYSARRLQAIYEALCEHRFHLDCGRGLAV